MHRDEQSASISVCSDDALWSVWSIWPGHSAKPALRGTASASAAAADVGGRRRETSSSRVCLSACACACASAFLSPPVGAGVCACVCVCSTLPHTPTERIEESTRTNNNPARPTVTLAAFPATDGQLARPPPNTLPRPHLKFIHPALIPRLSCPSHLCWPCCPCCRWHCARTPPSTPLAPPTAPHTRPPSSNPRPPLSSTGDCRPYTSRSASLSPGIPSPPATAYNPAAATTPPSATSLHSVRPSCFQHVHIIASLLRGPTLSHCRPVSQ
jgi:hypothetical protein